MYIFRRPFVKAVKPIITAICFLVLTVALNGCKFHQETSFMYRGPAPTMKRLNELKAMGIKTIVSVRERCPEKKMEYAQKLGLNWVTVKTSVMHSPKEEDIRKFLSIVTNPENQPVYVCCLGGVDRSVFYITAYRIAVEGKDPNLAVANMEGSTWHKLWPGFRYYVDILKGGAKDKYGWKPGEIINASDVVPDKENKAPVTTDEPKSM